MIFKFIDQNGTFRVKNPHKYNAYFPLTNKHGGVLSSISANLSGDIKKDNDHFITQPASSEDLRSTPLCIREFFIKVDNKVLRLSRAAQDEVEAGLLYHKITKSFDSVKVEITNFVPFDLDVELMQIKVMNKTKRDLKITPTSFIPLYGRAEKNLRDHRHVSSLLNRVIMDKYGVYLKPTMIFDERGHKRCTDIYYALGFENNGGAFAGQFPTLDSFYGDADIFSPDAVYAEKQPYAVKQEEFDGKEVCAGFRFKEKVLKPAEEVNYFILIGFTNDHLAIKKIFNKLNSIAKVEQYLEATKKYWINYLSEIEFDFNDDNFNNWLLWVKLQPTFRKLFGCSFLPHFDYGKGGRGWRDLWQDALTLLLTEPDKARDLILTNFQGVRLDGSNATIITKEGGFIADRNKISRVWMDHGVWPYLTTRLYLNRTNDLDLLLEKVNYFKDHQLHRAKVIDKSFMQKDFLQKTTSDKLYSGTILEHLLIQNLVQFFNVGLHNVVKLENADWNDGLDMAEHKGESVAFSFMYAHNLKDLCIYLEQLKEKTKTVEVLDSIKLLLDTKHNPIDYSSYKKRQERLSEYFTKVEKIDGKTVKIDIDDLINDLKSKAEFFTRWLSNHEWLDQGFFNGYYDDNANRVEGKVAKQLRMMLTSQVFAIMSGVANEQQISQTYSSIKKYLQDKKLGGFRLNSDLKDIYMELGRAFGFSYGDKENGAFFSHMNVMLANSLYKRGFINEGGEVINSIYNMAVSDNAKVYPCLPEYFNGQGKGLYLYLTGSASWYIYTLMEEVLGIKFQKGQLFLEPKLTLADFRKNIIQTSFSVAQKRVKLTYEIISRSQRQYKISKVLLNNKQIDSNSSSCMISTSCFSQKENNLTIILE